MAVQSTDGPQPTWQSLRWSKEKNGRKTEKQMQMCKACCIIPQKTEAVIVAEVL